MSFTPNGTGGKYQIKISESQLPKHTHMGNGGPLVIAGSGDKSQPGSGNNATLGPTSDGENCKNDYINVQNPYIVVNMWKRIS